jgi:single-strand DNA-binding protein|tara:strand:+ start:78 stop:500 length:423 start_codon:yes stop_codon:yes gene_type:complete
MSNETNLTIVGYLTADPELKNTSSGLAVVNITIASTPSKFNKLTSQWDDGQTLFMRATAWRAMAEQVVATMKKGDKVIGIGKLVAESYTDKEGNERTSTRLDLESVGIDLSRVPKTSYAEVPKSESVYEFANKFDEDSPF